MANDLDTDEGMSVLRVCGAALAATVCTGAIQAQSFDPNQTVAEYIAAKISESNATLGESFLAQTSAAVTDANTGVTAGSTSFKSATTDFLSLLKIAGLAESDQDANGNMVVDFDLIRRPESDARQVKLQAVLDAEPEPYAPLLDAIPAERRDAQAAILKDGLSESDSYTVTLSYNLYGDRVGRDFAIYRERFAGLVDRAYEVGGADLAGKVLGEAAGAVFDLLPDENLDGFERRKLSSLRGNGALIPVLDRIAENALALDTAYRTALTAFHLDRFSDLIDNQPQFHLSVESVRRSGSAGPYEQSIVATYEKGFVNLNSLLRDTAACGDWSSMDCLAGFRDYVDAHASALESKDRLAVSLKYTSIDAFEITLPAENGLQAPVVFQAPSSSKVTVGVDYGRHLVEYAGGDSWRIDAGLAYEDPSADAMNKRAVATVTLTRKLGDLSIPIGFVYANKPKFLMEADKELSAHIGFNYDLSALLGGDERR